MNVTKEPEYKMTNSGDRLYIDIIEKKHEYERILVTNRGRNYGLWLQFFLTKSETVNDA